MKKIYLVTGANGHLGSTVIRLLKKRNEEIRGFILPEIEREDQEKLHYIKGNVAKGCLLAAEKGRAGECYILSNQYYEIRYILDLVRRYAGGKRLPVLPVEIARAAVPFIQWYARKKGRRPLYTAYSLQVIGSFEHFSHEKATRELGYKPGKIEDTIKDTVKWYKRNYALK